jgi:glyoxylase-like metal-dependent hydrolase (beta-lactamase superfamily II)
MASGHSAAAECVGPDLDGSGLIDGGDLGMLLAAWGNSGPGHDADVNLDGVVDGSDLGIILASWEQPAPIGGALPAGGGGPGGWISGGPQCGVEPAIQVHWYNADTVILRQSLCTNFEAPFIVLLFGSEKILMMDTGAGNIQLAAKVTEVITAWKGLGSVASLQLVVAHTHGHGDHVAGNSQFTSLPNTVVVGNSQAAVKAFFGIATWPTQIVTYDLGGGRVVDIIPIPGHQSAHIAFYDRQTAILFTGDTLYPGRLYISAFNDYKASIARLVEFTADKPLCHVIGTHIEMSQVPGDDYPVGSIFHPNERKLELTRAHLIELHEAIVAMGQSPQYEVHDDFIIFPLGGAPQAGAATEHPLLAASGEGTLPIGVGAGVASGAEYCCERPKSMFELRRLLERSRAASGVRAPGTPAGR